MILDSEAPRLSRLSNSLARSVFRSFTFILVLLFVSYFFNAAQRRVMAQDDESAPDDVLRVRTDLVTIPAFVLDSHNRRVSGLKQSDFSIRDNGQVVALSYFAAGTEHVTLAFVLDASRSIREVVASQRDAALKLFSRFGKGSRVAVLHFGEKAELVVPFTTETDRAQPAFTARLPTSRRTAIFDAAATTLRAFAAEKSSGVERRILILISDGLDTASAVRASTVISEASALNVSIYVIHLPLYEPRDGRLMVRPASKGLRDLAEKTGGRYFLIGDAKSALDPQATPDLAPVFQAIEEDLQGQYVLGYYPDDAARVTDVHRLEINLMPRSGRKLRVRALREEYNLKP
ncbi:MAG: Ca-activated chloride channel [Acidobacteriota bacterium]|jgi:Ca-activated chloride channel family protein|nr:Ca-activated chloride channel [Acidobacteriota bacterium]